VRPRKNPELAGKLLESATRLEAWTLDLLRAMVLVESPSDDKAAVDRCAVVAERAGREIGGRVRRHRNRKFGDLLEMRFGPRRGAARPILLLGHLDTVWPIGTLTKMPLRIEKSRVWGPGVLDMKAGVAMGLAAVRILQQANLLTRPVIMLLNSDEEVGSPVSRAVTEKLAAGCDAVYVLEPAQSIPLRGPRRAGGSADVEGAYKTARKGVGDFTVRVTGLAAHSGVDFGRGHSAINELARQIERITSFTDLKRGLTVNVGVIGGGTRSNVIAGGAWAHVDVRIAKKTDQKRVEQLFHSLRPVDKGCSIELAGGINRPPMERTAATVALFNRAADFAKEMGFELRQAATGGGSDGNFTSALGIPTLDGMGAVGDGAHAAHESLVIEHIAPRTGLIAAMLTVGAAATS
jgi:glutamate carboxypeptidase